MILNLTQHNATPEQIESGVIDLTGDELLALKDALTFDALPSAEEIQNRAEYIAELALMFDPTDHGDWSGVVPSAMIGGAPYLMSALEVALKERGIKPLYAFSIRESVEQAQSDGSVHKINVFRHVGFVSP